MENTDLVSEFFDIDAAREATKAMPVNEYMSGAAQFENVGDEIEEILSGLGLSYDDSTYAFMSLKDSYDKLEMNDDGTHCDPNDIRPAFTAEVSDVLSFVAPDKSESELAEVVSKIVTTVMDQPPSEPLDMSDDMGPEEAKIEKEIDSSIPSNIGDNDTEDDLDPTFWD